MVECPQEGRIRRAAPGAPTAHQALKEIVNRARSWRPRLKGDSGRVDAEYMAIGPLVLRAIDAVVETVLATVARRVHLKAMLIDARLSEVFHQAGPIVKGKPGPIGAFGLGKRANWLAGVAR
jgi:hypothetical protein